MVFRKLLPPAQAKLHQRANDEMKRWRKTLTHKPAPSSKATRSRCGRARAATSSSCLAASGGERRAAKPSPDRPALHHSQPACRAEPWEHDRGDHAEGHRQKRGVGPTKPRRAERAPLGITTRETPQVLTERHGGNVCVSKQRVKADSLTPAYPVTRLRRSGLSRLPSRLSKGDGLSC
jgi:hypothetical protein